MPIKQSERVNPESNPNEGSLPYKDAFPADDDMILQKRKEGIYSKATSDTRKTRQDQSELSSMKEEEASIWETAAAKAKLPMTHGRNYGRSLTLEMENDALPFLTSKWIWLLLLVVIGLGFAGVTLLANNNSVEKMRPSRTKAKIKVRKASKR